MLKQEVGTLKEQLKAEKLEKVSMKAEIAELKVLVQQLINEEPKHHKLFLFCIKYGFYKKRGTNRRLSFILK